MASRAGVTLSLQLGAVDAERLDWVCMVSRETQASSMAAPEQLG